MKSHIITKNAIQCFLGALLVGVPLVSCGPTLEEGYSAQLSVAPREHVTFVRTKLGNSSDQTLIAQSTGSKDLVISNILWIGPNSIEVNYEASQLPITLAPGENVAVTVKFTPSVDEPSPEGIVRFVSNDLSHPELDIPVISQQMQPRIHTVPSKEETVVIPQTDVGDSYKKQVVVTNTGDLPLQISNISMQATPEFSLQYHYQPEFPITLKANSDDSLTFDVQFTPNSTGERTGNIKITSNDPLNGEYVLPITANSMIPCLLIQPQMLEFAPPVSVGYSKTKTVLLQSCSSAPLIIQNVSPLSPNALFTYNINDLNKELKYGESAELEITYTPTAEGTDTTTYVISSNDPLSANATLKVVGSASKNQCPVASARGRVTSSSTWAKNIQAAPLDNIILDGSQSTDAESSIETYRWEIVEKPDGSTSTLQTNGSQASFFVDLAGSYKFCLAVEDASGMESCNQDCLTLDAVPQETLHIQLVWHTPDDATVGDNYGTDLDVHFLRMPDGSWGDKGNAAINNGTDVFFQNQAPVWNVKDGHAEYPSLDIDDKNGDGPENVNLDDPNPCSWYAVGAHYFEDYGFGISYATVRIYISGKLRFEKANISLKQKAEFRQVAFIHWDGNTARVYGSDAIYTKDEDWIGLTPVIPDDILEQAKAASPSCFE